MAKYCNGCSEQFDAFLTGDQSLQYQQNLRAISVAIIVLLAPTNRLEDLVSLMPTVRAVLNTIQPGAVIEVS